MTAAAAYGHGAETSFSAPYFIRQKLSIAKTGSGQTFARVDTKSRFSPAPGDLVPMSVKVFDAGDRIQAFCVRVSFQLFGKIKLPLLPHIS